MHAEEGESQLLGALRKYNKPDKDKPGKDAKQIPSEFAKAIYWNALDRSFAVLLDAVERLTEDAFMSWNMEVRKALLAAYSQTCPHTTPRQIQAYAQGLKIIESWKGKSSHGSRN